MKKEAPSTAPDAAPAAAATPRAVYEVLVSEVKVGGVIAYRTARLNLSPEQADALNAAQAGTVRFLGI